MGQYFLRESLTLAYNGAISKQELVRFVFFSRGVCERHLYTFRPYVATLCYQEKINLSDLAYECIAPVFSLDEQKRFYRLRKFVDSLHRKLDSIDENSLFISFRSFFTTIINVEIARYHVELDPIGAKILRGLKLTVKHSTIAKIEESPFGVVIKSLQNDLFSLSDDFPIDLLERELVSRKAMSKIHPGFVHDVISILNEQEKYRRSILLYDLVALKKKYMQLEEKEILTEVSYDKHFYQLFSSYEISYLKERSLKFMERKANSLYTETEKISAKDLSIIIETLRRIINEWFSGDGNEKYYIDHLRHSLPITKQEYNHLWKNKIEYLAKLVKLYIAEKITKEHF